MYANESGGSFPMAGSRALQNMNAGPNNRYNKFSLDGKGLYPEYLTDIKIMVCPSDVSADAKDLQDVLDAISAGDPDGIFPGKDLTTTFNRNHATTKLLQAVYSYGYIGWVTNDNNSLYGYREGHKNLHKKYCGTNTAFEPCDLDRDMSLEVDLGLNIGKAWSALADRVVPTPLLYGSGGGKILYRTREGVERFLITDINNPAGSAQSQSSIPVYLDMLGSAERSNKVVDLSRVANTNHLPGGSNVLFMDGHVEFIKYPGRHPISKLMGFVLEGGGSTGEGLNLSEL